MLDVKQVTKQFGSVTAVDSLSFTAAEPQVIGIIGRSGAGKSTFLRMMNRMTDATSGQLLVDGVDVLALKGRAKADWQRNCAMIFQQFNLVPRLDVITNVILGRLNQQSVLRSSLMFFTQTNAMRRCACSTGSAWPRRHCSGPRRFRADSSSGSRSAGP